MKIICQCICMYNIHLNQMPSWPEQTPDFVQRWSESLMEFILTEVVDMNIASYALRYLSG